MLALPSSLHAMEINRYYGQCVPTCMYGLPRSWFCMKHWKINFFYFYLIYFTNSFFKLRKDLAINWGGGGRIYSWQCYNELFFCFNQKQRITLISRICKNLKINFFSFKLCELICRTDANILWNCLVFLKSKSTYCLVRDDHFLVWK